MNVGNRIVNSGIPICLIAILRRLLNFLVELFGDEASEEAGWISFNAMELKTKSKRIFTRGDGKRPL